MIWWNKKVLKPGNSVSFANTVSKNVLNTYNVFQEPSHQAVSWLDRLQWKEETLQAKKKAVL